MNRINIEHLITLYRRSDASRLPDVSTDSIASAVRVSRSRSRISLFDLTHPFRFISPGRHGLRNFLLVFLLVSHPAHPDNDIAINISRDRISVPAPRMERLMKKQSQEHSRIIGRDGRDVSVKL